VYADEQASISDTGEFLWYDTAQAARVMMK
jgi:hypothetical protein